MLFCHVGDLARLNAFQRLDENIPGVLKPYSYISDGDALLKAALSKVFIVQKCIHTLIFFNFQNFVWDKIMAEKSIHIPIMMKMFGHFGNQYDLHSNVLSTTGKYPHI